MNKENGTTEATMSEREQQREGSQVEEVNNKNNNNNVGITTNKVSLSKLFSFADTKDMTLMIIGSVAAIGNGVCMPLMAILFGDVVDAFGQNHNNKHVISTIVSQVSLKFVYLAIGVAIAGFLQVSCWMVTGERQAARIRNLYLKSILRQEIAFFDKETNTGEIIGRLSGDIVLVQDAMGEKVGQLIQLMSTFIGGFVIAFFKGWLLTLVMLSSVPLLVIAGALLTVIVSKMASKGQIAYAKAANVVQQTISSIRTVASFTGEKRAIKEYNKAIVSAYKSGVNEGLAVGVGLGSVLLFMFSTYSLAIWFGSRMILHKHYNGGTVISVLTSVLTASMALGQASPCMSAFATSQVAAYKLFEIIQREPKIDPCDQSGKVFDDINGDIELRDVHFSYPTRPNEKIFNGFSLSIPSGITTALVGQSGSGKSTIISLIQRFYDPNMGHVLIDRVDLKEYQLRWIRQKIGLVSQEPILFSSSIRDNIAYGKDGVKDEEIRVAATFANASNFIDKLPKGFDTLVGEHGTQLSGGQKQRIAIARAILKDPRILLLDEATSALDVESEKIVQEALDRVMANRTTVVVAHRLSTVRNANMIALIHQGKVVEKGSHMELLKIPNGAYSQLIKLQEMKKEYKQANNVNEISRSSSESSFERVNSNNYVNKSNLVQSPNKQTSVSIKRLAYLNKPEVPFLVLGSLFATLNGVVFPIFSILFSSVIKSFYEQPHNLREDSRFWALMFLILGLTSLVANSGRAYFFSIAGCKLIKRIRSKCFERVVNMEISWFDENENSSGAIGARLSIDATSVRGLVGDALGLVVQNLATAIAGLLIAFLANWMLSLIILVIVPLIGVNGYLQLKFMKGFSANTKRKYEEATQVANDAIGNIRVVASFCAESKVVQLFEKKCKGPFEAGIKSGLISGVGFGLSFGLVFCVYATCFYAGSKLVEHGKATFAEVFRVFFALTMVAVGISRSSSIVPDTNKVKNAVDSIFALLDRKSKIDPSDESRMTLDDVKGEIELKHVMFRYPMRPDIEIFHDLCLTIRAGKTVALVGESGSGKSTVISLLQRFYDPNSGCITLDGIDIEKLQLKWLRRQMGLVSQEPILFNDTIHANIAYGKGDNATQAEIIEAAKLANAHNFISSLQEGYDTVVGERGIQLSGGQKQRVAIARAIVKNPKILLLDEATSALDGESERVVQNALDKAIVNRTTIMVAHRLSTIINSDVIAVVKNGVIVEKGNHETLLLLKHGVYASLVALHSSESF